MSISDKTLSEIMYSPYETIRRQDKLRNATTLRYLMLKDFEEDELRKRVKDTITKHDLNLYSEEELKDALKEKLKEEDRFNNYIFKDTVEEVVADINKSNFRNMPKAPRSSMINNIDKYVDLYAYKDRQKIVFKVMYSRQSAANIKELLYLFKQLDNDYTLCILSFEENIPKIYTDLGAEVILISTLLSIDVDKVIIIPNKKEEKNN